MTPLLATSMATSGGALITGRASWPTTSSSLRDDLERHPAAPIYVVRPDDDLHHSSRSSHSFESLGDSRGKVLQGLFGAHLLFPEINIDSCDRSRKAVGGKDGDNVDRVVTDFERRHARQCLPYRLLNFRQPIFLSQVENRDERHQRRTRDGRCSSRSSRTNLRISST